MSGFSADWLALREPADWRARSAMVTGAIADALRDRPVVRAVDLAAGTGSNVRYLQPRLPVSQEWLLLDHDRELLDEARRRMTSDIRTEVIDLSRVDRFANRLKSRDLVTASALLDLVSERWLNALCEVCTKTGAVVLLALSYDGRITFAPHEREDELIRELVNRHQRTNKGFGEALGPTAGERSASALATLGYRVIRDRSDWIIEADSGALQRQLIEGWANAAAEIAPSHGDSIAAWRVRRLEHVAERRSRLVVGHEDIGAFRV